MAGVGGVKFLEDTDLLEVEIVCMLSDISGSNQPSQLDVFEYFGLLVWRNLFHA